MLKSLSEGYFFFLFFFFSSFKFPFYIIYYVVREREISLNHIYEYF